VDTKVTQLKISNVKIDFIILLLYLVVILFKFNYSKYIQLKTVDNSKSINVPKTSLRKKRLLVTYFLTKLKMITCKFLAETINVTSRI